MAMAKPVITTKTAGCEETVDEGVNGYLIPARSANELSNAINEFLNQSHEKQLDMGLKGLEKVKKEFDDKKIAKKIYESIAPFISS